MRFFRKVAARFDFRAPFRSIPVERTTNYTLSHLGKGSVYHEGLSRLPGRRITWQAEQEFLSEFTRRNGPFELHLDFAGGTGRIAGALESDCAAQVVLDVSDTMLAVARTYLKRARLVCGDFRRIGKIMRSSGADLVTAFRFFPNAEPALRESAMEFISRSLRRRGFLVCNNHRNFWSVPYVGGRLIFSRRYTSGMTNKAMMQLAARHGLTLVATHSIGVIPQNETVALLPWRAVERLEKAVSRRWGGRHRAGYDVIFVFAKI